MPVLYASIDPQHGSVVPTIVADLSRQPVPIVLVASRPHHYVDAGATAQDPAHRHWDASAVQSRIRTGFKRPVLVAAAQRWPRRSIHDVGYFVAAASLQQKHVDGRIFGQATRYHRS